MKLLTLSLKNIGEDGSFASVQIKIPVSGDNQNVAKLLEVGYLKLVKDLKNLQK